MPIIFMVLVAIAIEPSPTKPTHTEVRYEVAMDAIAHPWVTIGLAAGFIVIGGAIAYHLHRVFWNPDDTT